MARSVLIVDDDQMALRLLEHHLTKAGYDVLRAENGLAALEIISREAPSIVISDWVMPEVDGIELCRMVRDNQHLGTVYIIILTGHSDVERIVEAFDAGADDYLSKPFNERELLARMRAGERIVDLERNLAQQQCELARRNAELEMTHRQLKEVNRELDQLATTDPLTNLPNRRAAMNAIDDAWSESERDHEPLAAVLIDIDHFKLFNDEHGHDVGDVVLCEIGRILDGVTRTSEHIYRIGGEEFLLLCPRSKASMAAIAAERMRREVAENPVHHNDMDLKVTISVGVAERVPAMKSVTDLLKAADLALYEAKKSGRNCVRLAPLAPHVYVRVDEPDRQAG